MLFIMAGVQSFLLILLGMGLGIIFIIGTIGFTTAWRRFILVKDPSGMYLQFFLLLVGLYLFVPTLSFYETLQPAAAPVGLSVLIGAFFFGFSMQIANGCGSGILASTGSGKHILFVLIFFAFGSFLGTLNFSWWLSLSNIGEIIFYKKIGVFSTLLFQTVLLTVLTLLVYLRCRKTSYKIWHHKGMFPYFLMLMVSFLSFAILLISGVPWGIVYGLGLWVAKILSSLGFTIESLVFWSKETSRFTLENSILLDTTSLTTIGFILGAWAISYRSRMKTCLSFDTSFQSGKIFNKKSLINIIGALSAGYFSRVAFGCNIGGLYSGIISSSFHGWIWFASAFIGSLLAVRIRPFCGMKNP